MADYLELAREHLGLEEGQVLSHRQYEEEIVIVADLGIQGCPKYRVPLADLAQAQEAESELADLDYRDLQALAKQHGIAANQSADDLSAAIVAELIAEEEE